MKKRNVTMFVLGATVLIAFSFVSLFSGDGLSSSRACGWGWGEKHKRIQTDFLAAEFHETLPQTLVLNQFECTGFQDLEVTADFEMDHSDGLNLVAALETTYQSPQSEKYIQSAEKKRLETTYPDKKRFLFTLPANGILHIRKLEVFVPNDQSKPVNVKFEGFQY